MIIFFEVAGRVLPIKLVLTGNTMARPGNGLQSLLGNFFLAAKTYAIRPVVNTGQSCFDTLQQLRLLVQLTNRDFPVHLLLQSVPIANTITLQVILTSRSEEDILRRCELPLQALHARGASKTLIDPLLAINGTVVPGPYDYVDVEGGVKMEARFSTDLIKNLSGVLSVKYPFLNDLWRDSVPVTTDSDDFDLTLVRKSADESEFYLQRNTRDFYNGNEGPGCWEILAFGSSETYKLKQSKKCNDVTNTNNAIFDLLTPSLARLEIKNKVLMASDSRAKNTQDVTKLKFLLIPPGRPGDSITVSVSSEKAEDTAQKTQLDKDQVQFITQNDSSFVTFKGTELSGVKFITVDGVDLVPDSVKKNQVSVLINRALTKQPGTLDILIRDGTKSVVGTAKIVISPCAACSPQTKP